MIDIEETADQKRARLRWLYEDHFRRMRSRKSPPSTFMGFGGLWMLLDDEAPKYERVAFVNKLPDDPHAWGTVTELMRIRVEDEAWRIGAEVNMGRLPKEVA